MLKLFKKLSLMPAGLRYKLVIVFALMSIIPLMVSGYIVSNFVIPNMQGGGLWIDLLSLSATFIITIFIAISGFIVARQMVEPIISVASTAKLIANGDYERSIQLAREDEIGDLGVALNTMTQKIKENISELKAYSDKTREINLEIQKKIMALSGLLQVGNLISSGTDLKTTMDILVEKTSLLDGANFVAIMIVDRENDTLTMVSNINLESIETLKMPVSMQRGIFAKLREELKEIIIDKRITKEDKFVTLFRSTYGILNVVILPIALRGRLEGAMLVGTNIEGFEYKDDNIDLLRVFCKQAAIAVENNMLIKKAEELEIKDELTDLYNSKYIRERLDEEIRRAFVYQRPCSFILLNIDNFREFCTKHSRLAGETALRKIARLIADELTPVDKAARFGDDEFALILPERSKKETKQIAEDIRQKISQLVILPDAEEKDRYLTVSGSLSEDPVDGISAKELIDKAIMLMKEAKLSGKNMIKV